VWTSALRKARLPSRMENLRDQLDRWAKRSVSAKERKSLEAEALVKFIVRTQKIAIRRPALSSIAYWSCSCPKVHGMNVACCRGAVSGRTRSCLS